MIKKGASQLIATVLLILIGLTLAGIIFNFASGFIEKQERETEGFSFYYDAKIKDAELFSVSGGGLPPGGEPSGEGDGGDEGGGSSIENKIQIAVERIDNEGDVSGVRFVFEGGGNSYSYDDEAPNEAGIVKIYEISSHDLGIDDFSEIETVSVMLLYGEEKVTKILDIWRTREV